MHRCHHRSASVARLYIPRPKGGRGLLSLRQEWERSVLSAVAHRRQSKDPQIKGVVRRENQQTAEGHRTALSQATTVLAHHDISVDDLNTVNPQKLTARVKQSQIKQLEETLLGRRIHGTYARELREPDTDTRASVRWLVDGVFVAETEATLVEMQDGTTRTRKCLHEVTGQTTLSKTCRACGSVSESLGHILSSCSAHYFSLYKHRHDRVLYVLVRQVIVALGYHLPKHLTAPGGTPRTGVYGDKLTIVKVDLRSPTDEVVTHSRPDLVIRLMRERVIYIVEVACAWDGSIRKREKEKESKYRRLAADLARTWKCKTLLVSFVIGALGIVKSARSHLQKLHFLQQRQVTSLLASAQREALVGSLRTLKQHMKLWTMNLHSPLSLSFPAFNQCTLLIPSCPRKWGTIPCTPCLHAPNGGAGSAKPWLGPQVRA